MKIRSLTTAEKCTLRCALEGLAHLEGPAWDNANWSAKAMLEQNMVDNFLWIQKREEEK